MCRPRTRRVRATLEDPCPICHRMACLLAYIRKPGPRRPSPASGNPGLHPLLGLSKPPKTIPMLANLDMFYKRGALIGFV